MGKVTKKTLVLAGSGTGKTMASILCKNVVDLGISKYAYVYDLSLSREQSQNLLNNWLANPNNYPAGIIKPNPCFPNNFFDAIFEAMKENVALIPFIKGTFELIDNNAKFKDIRIILVFPEKDNFAEYAERFRKRGNDENFITIRETEFTSLVNIFETAAGYEKLTLGKGKFLVDVLMENGIIDRNCACIN